MSSRVVSDLLGVPVRYYVLADFSGFKKVVDILGGVTIDVDQDMYHDDDDGYSINLKKGVQRLDGDKALQYVRYRGYAMADIERTHYQQKFLMALAHEMFQTGTILKLPALVPEINRYVKTNMNAGDLIQFATIADNLKDGNMIAQTLPGQPVTIGDGSYWAADLGES
ncbi:MAG: Regulatory protein MsrR [Pelotomaculum sp. PtaB.Bin104]|nr:MAG: Regulatory protein MsrR [Pelotomaculum sp. PtaB.Bin104]